MRTSRSDDNVLHISPCQVRVGLKGKRTDSSGEGSRSRGARMARRARVMEINGDDLETKQYKNKVKS
jgi:hypothetical protein